MKKPSDNEFNLKFSEPHVRNLVLLGYTEPRYLVLPDTIEDIYKMIHNQEEYIENLKKCFVIYYPYERIKQPFELFRYAEYVLGNNKLIEMPSAQIEMIKTKNQLAGRYSLPILSEKEFEDYIRKEWQYYIDRMASSCSGYTSGSFIEYIDSVYQEKRDV